MLIAVTVMNVSNYLFHVAVSRVLGPTAYGALSALLAVMLVLSVPFGVLQATVARRVAILRSEGASVDLREVTGGTMRLVLPMAVLAFAGLLVLGPVLGGFLHVGTATMSMVAGYAFFSLLLAVPLGCLQGTLRFRRFAALTLVGVGIRFVVGVGLVRLGLGPAGAVAGSVASQAVMLTLGLRSLGVSRRTMRSARPTLDLIHGGLVGTLLGLGAFWLLAESDVVLARHFLDTTSGGLYASSSVLARALLFLPGAISVAALPRFAELRGQGAKLRDLLGAALGAVATLSAVSLAGMLVLRDRAVAFAFGRAFVGAETILPALAVGAAVLAVLMLLVYFHVAVATRGYLIVFGGAALQAGLIALFHGSAAQVAWCVAIAAAATTAVLAHAAFAACRTRPRADAEIGPSEPSERSQRRLSVVLPCHNAGSGLRDVLAGLATELRDVDHEVVVVSDGSTDSTVEIARSAGARVIEHAVRSGKGHALRIGLAEAGGEYVAFMDSDGDIAPGAIRPFLALMRMYEPDIVLGSKRHPLTEIEYPMLRRVLSWTYHKIARVLFRVNVRDTQTGLKLLRRDVLTAVLPLMLEKRYAFDLELLVVAKRLGFTRVFEAPVQIDYRFSSQIDPRQAFGILKDTFAIFYRRYVLNTYGPRTHRSSTSTDDRDLSVSEDDTTVAVSSASAAKSMRILVVNWRDIRNPDAGGAEVYTHEVAQRWVRAGHEVTLLTSRFDGARSKETVDGVRVRRVGRLRRGTFHLAVQRELARLDGFDVILDEINTVPFFAPVWSRRGTRTVALIHQLAEDVWDAELPAPLAAIGRGLEPRMLSAYRDVPIATVSASTRADLARLGLGRVTVIPQGREAPGDVELPLKETFPTFLYVGRLASNKRPDHAVQAFRHIRERVPRAQLWIVGRGPMEGGLRSSLPQGAELLGHLPRAELFERMARAHCLLVPSVREGWGMVITEANGVGTPAVGYDVPGVRDAIRDGMTGVISSAGDPEALAEAALALVVDARRYAVMREQALAWASRFSWDATADALLEMLAAEPTPAAAGPSIRDNDPQREEAPRELVGTLLERA